VGTPTISDILVKVTVVDHIKGPKIDRFKYRPKKRIRVRGGHRQQFTRLLVDFIGRPDEERTLAPHASAGEVEKAEPAPVAVEAAPEVEKAPKEKKQARAKKASAETAAAKKKSTAKSSTKKTDTKKK
jgi:hypothetical protein